jgi:antitoxin (DNA-binding transcriptional repressor) of toxin-antitoxin stability system
MRSSLYAVVNLLQARYSHLSPSTQPSGVEVTIVVNVHEAKTHFSRLLVQAHAGQEILLAQADKPYARFMPLERGSTRRQAGRLQGRVTETFFEPLAEKDVDAWESR